MTTYFFLAHNCLKTKFISVMFQPPPPPKKCLSPPKISILRTAVGSGNLNIICYKLKCLPKNKHAVCKILNKAMKFFSYQQVASKKRWFLQYKCYLLRGRWSSSDRILIRNPSLFSVMETLLKLLSTFLKPSYCPVNTSAI